MSPEAVARASWIATGVMAGVAVALTVLASLLYKAVVRVTHMRGVAVTVSVVASLFIFALSPIVMDGVVNALVNPPSPSDSLSLFHIWVDPGPLQKLVPLAAIALTWLFVSVARHKSAERRLSNSG